MKAQYLSTTPEDPFYRAIGIKHVGILIKDEEGNPIVLHKSNNKKNECGGFIVWDTPKEFFKNRKSVKRKNIWIDPAQLDRILQRDYCNSKYNLLKGNCEHFAREIAYGKKESPQLRKGLFIASGVFLLITAAIVRNADNNQPNV